MSGRNDLQAVAKILEVGATGISCHSRLMVIDKRILELLENLHLMIIPAVSSSDDIHVIANF